MQAQFVAVLLFLCIHVSHACVCVIPPGTNHIQTDLCNAEVSFIGKVIDVIPSMQISVKVSRSIKGSYTAGQIITNISPGWVGTSCFPSFSPSAEDYLFTASSADAGVGECDFVTKLSDLSQEQLTYLMYCKRRRYVSNCHCRIIDSASKATSSTCLRPYYYEHKHFLNRYGMCLLTKDHCEWYTIINK